MMRNFIVDDAGARRYEDVLIAFRRANITFSKAMAAKLVGGESRLERLVHTGEIRMEKPTCKQNGKWHCVAADVISKIKV